MKLEEITKIYDYNYWANKRLLAAASRIPEDQFLAPAAFPRGGLRGTLVHILEGEYGWRNVMVAGHWPEDLKEQDFSTVDSLSQRWRVEEAAMRTYLSSLTDEDLTGNLRYLNPDGVRRERALWHCLFHVVNHGTQHRSEAAAILTSLGDSPGDVDFTLFLIEQAQR